MTIETSEQQEIIQRLSEKLRTLYIFPDIAEKICQNLQKHLDAGEYAEFLDGEFLALALTMHLQEINHDEHLWVRWHPEPLPDDEGPLRQNQEWQEERKLQARLDNYGLHKIERLPGNVGLLDIRTFHRPAWGGNTAVAAMNFLTNTNALIIDLRKCTGGYPGMIALIASYFFGEEALHLETIHWSDDHSIQQHWTLPYIPGQHFLDKPVYVLVSKSTFSGGEDFAYILQTRKRATVVGEKTDGGAHAGASYRIHPHFEALIPIGRIINAITGTDWEGTGVIPDVPIPQEQAFRAAYQLALQSIYSSLPDSPSGPYKNFAQEIQTALKELASS